ncbi:MAG: hypothetical protein GF364_11875, partial [Candidatus Lokiarchaeota archaeon]|nr:hypothetical protein [Candidatus Lokiarchaeota archaeon]
MTHRKNRINITIIFALIMLSMISSGPVALGAIASLESTLGHNFEEEAWSVSYDFSGDHLQNDYNPGDLDDQKDVGLTDSDTNIDNTYYGAYVNTHGVHTLY